MTVLPALEAVDFGESQRGFISMNRRPRKRWARHNAGPGAK
jgi:hypothetical protein